MGLIWVMLVGLAVGALAKLFMPGKDPGGIIVTMLIGLAGAALAGFLGRHLGWYHWGEAPGFLASIGGSMLLLLGYRFTLGRARA